MQVVAERVQGLERREVRGEIRVGQLENVLRQRQVLQPVPSEVQEGGLVRQPPRDREAVVAESRT